MIRRDDEEEMIFRDILLFICDFSINIFKGFSFLIFFFWWISIISYLCLIVDSSGLYVLKFFIKYLNIFLKVWDISK